MVFQTPLPRLRLERQMLGDEDCLSAESTSSGVTTQMLRKDRRKQAAGGALLFGYFLLSKQK